MRHFLLASVALLALSLFGACDGSTDPGESTSLPYGRYLYKELVQQGAVTRELRSAIELRSADNARIYDTIYRVTNGELSIDSVFETELHLGSGGAGYQRAVEIHKVLGAPVDTTLHYWYFFRRGDSLFYYKGDRFTGGNIGLTGKWMSDPKDSAVVGWRTDIDFRASDVEIRRVPVDGGQSESVFPYTESKNTIAIQGDSPFAGDRYQIVPGWALFITTHAAKGYVIAR